MMTWRDITFLMTVAILVIVILIGSHTGSL
jgi:hypothetical protein